VKPLERELTIDGVRIADDTDCYVIAEIGHNHQGDVEKCKAMFVAAQEAGASAVKLQKRENRSLFTREAFDRPYDHENSFGPTYGTHREALEFGWDEYQELKQYAKELGITFFATAFDVASVDFLGELDVPAIKIASGDLKSLYLLEYAAKLQKPMVVSTGVATMSEVQRAYDTIMPINPQFCLLQCTAAYPPEFDQLDLRVITTFREQFPDVVIGFSSHDNGIAMAAVAYTLGARVVEKHFTLNRAMKGTDHAFSLEPVGLRKLVRDLRRARVALGTGDKRIHANEVTAGVKMGKKIVARHDLGVGQVLELKDVAMKSPGDGLSPDHLSDVLGRTLLQPLRADDSIALDMLG
jgi:sialic acid synthase